MITSQAILAHGPSRLNEAKDCGADAIMKTTEIVLTTVAVGFMGCAHVTPQATSTSFSPEAMDVVGPAKGESTQTKALCLIPLSNDEVSVIAATEAALLSVNAEALINSAVDDERGIGVLGLWCWQTIRVSGTAVRFKSRAGSGPARKGDPTSDLMIEGMKKRAIRQ